jgi:Asp-tRNA(Asn)/Glu-tRNA(Gln) amidotransferase A subunit family amidase
MGRRPIFRAALVPTAAVLRTGELQIAAYLEQVRARMEQLDSDVQAFVPEPDRWHRIRREVSALEARTRDGADRPALYGVAVGIKDCFRVDGLPTRAGSELPSELFGGSEASAVSTLRAAGAVILGKTAMDEFAYGEPTRTRNPHNLARTPGGSSSGSAAAVAAGTVSPGARDPNESVGDRPGRLLRCGGLQTQLRTPGDRWGGSLSALLRHGGDVHPGRRRDEPGCSHPDPGLAIDG